MWRNTILPFALLCNLVSSIDVAPQQPLLSSKRLVLSDDLVEFHKNLTRIESITYNEQEAGKWLTGSLKSQGYTVEKQYIEDDSGRFNIFAYLGKTRETKILVSSHYDTVPPFYPYTYKNGTIGGRGSVDDKGSLAAQLVAVNDLLKSGKVDANDISLLFVVGEETGGDGMRRANDLGLRPKVVVFGEPTEGKLVSGHKGNDRLQINAIGKAAHSGYPWLGRSANEVLVRALAALIEIGPNLPKSDKYGETTINIGTMSGGVAGNVVAQSASASITIRLATGDYEKIEAEITKAIHLAMESFLEGDMTPEDVVELKFADSARPPVDIDADIPGFDVITVNYGTDIPWLEKTVPGQKRYLYGPGSILVAHSDHEALTEDELFSAVSGYQKIIEYALQANE